MCACVVVLASLGNQIQFSRLKSCSVESIDMSTFFKYLRVNDCVDLVSSDNDIEVLSGLTSK